MEDTLVEDTKTVEAENETPASIKETDIVFECPHCTKSLAIDYRGAGLTILCSDCGQGVQVPIPDGMEISDLDNTGAEQEGIILQLRRALMDAHSKLEQMQTENRDLGQRGDVLHKLHGRDIERLERIEVELDSIRRCIDQIQASVGLISKTIRGSAT
jgi:hypothetical protein